MYKMPTRKIFWLRIITSVIIIFALMSICVVSFHIVYTRTYVKGASMYPTLNASFDTTNKRDVVYINRFNKGEVGDIVVLDLRTHPSFGNYTIKRLIATEGDIVDINFDLQTMQYHLLVNDNIVYSKSYQEGFNSYNAFEQYIENHKHDSTRILQDENNNQSVIIKQNEIFVLGDNWQVSKDSSLVGPLNKNTIVGRVDIIVQPNENEFLQILKGIF